MKAPKKTWPEGVAPTGEQLVEWVRSFGPEHDLSVAIEGVGSLQYWAQKGSRCFQSAHDEYPRQVEHLQEALRRFMETDEEYLRLSDECRRLEAQVSRLRYAWWSARRRGIYLIRRMLDEREAAR